MPFRWVDNPPVGTEGIAGRFSTGHTFSARAEPRRLPHPQIQHDRPERNPTERAVQEATARSGQAVPPAATVRTALTSRCAPQSFGRNPTAPASAAAAIVELLGEPVSIITRAEDRWAIS
jgi:hypothetical protein